MGELRYLLRVTWALYARRPYLMFPPVLLVFLLHERETLRVWVDEAYATVDDSEEQ